jgi:hypothetical protein
MKSETISAKVPANVEKGTEELSATITVNSPETVEEAVQMFGGPAVLSNALAHWEVVLQANIRGGLRKGEAPASIAARLAGAKMGVASTGTKVDTQQAYLAMFQSATPEKQAEMLKELKERAKKG